MHDNYVRGRGRRRGEGVARRGWGCVWGGECSCTCSMQQSVAPRPARSRVIGLVVRRPLDAAQSRSVARQPCSRSDVDVARPRSSARLHVASTTSSISAPVPSRRKVSFSRPRFLPVSVTLGNPCRPRLLSVTLGNSCRPLLEP